MSSAHGGDIYRNQVQLDFSVNLNPFGMPEGVRQALISQVDRFSAYPDTECALLCAGLSARFGVPAGCIVCGNGAAELLYDLVRVLRPRRALVAVPTFTEYEAALSAVGCEARRFVLREADGFRLDVSAYAEAVTEDTDLVFLCNPNNPNGLAVPREEVLKLADICRKKQARLIVDECFAELLTGPGQYSVLPHKEDSAGGKEAAENNAAENNAAENKAVGNKNTENKAVENKNAKNRGIKDTGNFQDRYPNLVILRAFTKSFALAGLRLGYLVCGDAKLLETLKAARQPWNVSVPAQVAGEASLSEIRYLKKSRRAIAGGRKKLSEGLEACGFTVYPSDTNFLLFSCRIPDLKERCLKHGILIRSCADYAGLPEGVSFYRVCVKLPEENSRLLQALAASAL